VRNPGSSTNALAPGEFATATVQATAVPTSTTVANPHTLVTAARQSNEFSGPPGNAFERVGGDPTITVVPGQLASFVFGSIGNQTAGTPFSVSATAYDAFGNFKYDYNGTPTLTGNLSTAPTGCSGPCAPSYGAVSFTGGTGSGLVTAYVAESGRTLTLTDGSVSPTAVGTSGSFTVGPAVPGVITFTQQPTETQVNTTINASLPSPGVKIEVRDVYSNIVAPGTPASVAIGLHIGTGVLQCAPGPPGCTTATTDANGIATFDRLRIDAAGAYTLTATSGAATKPSAGFLIVDTLTTCTGSPCSSPSGATSATATGVVNSGDQVGVAQVVGGATVPEGVCDGFTPPLDSVLWIANVVTSAGSQPTLTISVVIPQEIVNQQPNSGASQWDICMGAFDLRNPDNVPPDVVPWTEQDGTPADPVFDPILGIMFFWGIVPDAPPGIATCDDAASASLGPVVLSKNKVGGDVVIVFCSPYPWDPQGIAG
jgi:hypothetical protein